MTVSIRFSGVYFLLAVYRVISEAFIRGTGRP